MRIFLLDFIDYVHERRRYLNVLVEDIISFIVWILINIVAFTLIGRLVS